MWLLIEVWAAEKRKDREKDRRNQKPDDSRRRSLMPARQFRLSFWRSGIQNCSAPVDRAKA